MSSAAVGALFMYLRLIWRRSSNNHAANDGAADKRNAKVKNQSKQSGSVGPVLPGLQARCVGDARCHESPGSGKGATTRKTRH